VTGDSDPILVKGLITAKGDIITVDDHRLQPQLSIPLAPKSTRNIVTCLVDKTKHAKRYQVPHHRASQHRSNTTGPRDPTQVLRLEAPEKELPLLGREIRRLRENLHDGVNRRQVNIISGILVVTTNKVLSRLAPVYHSRDVHLTYVTTHEPRLPRKVVVKTLMHGTQDLLNLGRLHRDNTKLALRLRHPDPKVERRRGVRRRVSRQGTSFLLRRLKASILVRNQAGLTETTKTPPPMRADDTTDSSTQLPQRKLTPLRRSGRIKARIKRHKGSPILTSLRSRPPITDNAGDIEEPVTALQHLTHDPEVTLTTFSKEDGLGRLPPRPQGRAISPRHG
jgi:hypothetical protein